ncbi:MAG: hypothetical protein H6Q60_1161 [Oscillospiraceae bacterium]|nr:hypothetical protein [Oscillospiraceae bacterium]
MSGTVKITLNPVKRIIRDKGLDESGAVQKFHTQNCLRRIQKYMPFKTGATIKLTIAHTDISKPEIVTNVPYAKYLFYGKAMEGNAPKKLTSRDLSYTKTKNPRAGSRWDRALVAAEGKAITADLQRYFNRRAT